MPVTLNPPPFPTPDNNKVNAADKTADAHDGPTDAFAALLTAAGDAPVDAANGDTTVRPGIDVQTVPGNIDQTFSPRALGRGSGHKPPVVTLPIEGADEAAPVRGIKPGATLGLAAADKPDSDRKDGDDTATTTAATDLAGMSAMLSALLSPTDRAATLGDGKAGAKVEAAGVAGAGSGGADIARAGSAAAAAKTDASFAPSLLQSALQDARETAMSSADALAAAVAAKTDATDRSTQADMRLARTLDADAVRASATAPSAVSAATLAAAAVRDDVANAKPGNDKSDTIAAANAPQAPSLFQHDTTLQRADSIAIATPVTSPGWQGEFAEKLGQVIMTGGDRAEFRLHPANMGPVEVSITVNADQASVMITAPHATTRDALEQALPQLRDLLAGQGITLGQANVQSEHRPSDQAPRSRDIAATVDVPAVADIAVRTVRSIGLVDTFA